MPQYNFSSWKEGRKHGALRPQKPLRLIRDGEVGGSGIFVSNAYSLHCHHQNDSALRWAVVWAIFMFYQLCGQSHKTASINHNFSKEEKGESKRIEPKSFCLPAKRLIDRPQRLKSQKHRAVLIYATGEGIQLCSSRALLHSVPFKPIE